MTATLLNGDDVTFDEALQQSVGELGRGQRWRFALVRASVICMLLRDHVQAAAHACQRADVPNNLNTVNRLMGPYRRAWRWSQLRCKPSSCTLLPSIHSGSRPGSAKILQTPYAKQH